MSPTYTGEWGFIISTALVIAFRAFVFKRLFWDAPLNHGPGFFLGVEVTPGFYEGEGARWLRRYHKAWFVEISLEALMLVGFIVLAPRLLIPWWVLLPFWVMVATMLAVATGSGFAALRARHAGSEPARPPQLRHSPRNTAAQ